MNLCVYPSPIQEIDQNDYLGPSLYTLNSNYLALQESVCYIEKRYKDSAIEYLEINNRKKTLESLLPAIPFAHIVFRPNISPAEIVKKIPNNLNLDINKLGIGSYRITTSGLGLRYAVVGTSNNTTIVTIAQGSLDADAFTINIRNSSWTLTDPASASIIIFKE